MLIGSESLIEFSLVSIALIITPGADMTFILTTSAKHGFRAGISALTGANIGILIHIILASLGLTALLTAIPGAFTFLKMIGTVYLIYLAYQMVSSSSSEAHENNDKENTALYLLAKRGILVNLLNPKIGIFFIAFLPQFVDTAREDIATQTFMLGLLFCFLGFTINAILCAFTVYSAQKIAVTQQFKKLLCWFAASLLAGFAIRLGLS